MRSFASVKWVIFCCLFGITGFAHGFNTVVIDAGHGGHDRGGIPGQKIAEKPLALDVALRLRRILREEGVRTVMTRTDDTFIPLQTRVNIGNAQRNALFLSIHFNSAKREGASGIETFYYGNKSYRYAARIHNRLIRHTSAESRGVKKQRYYVLRKARNPAVLVECGFLTNRAEGQRCLIPEYRQKLARALASALLEMR